MLFAVVLPQVVASVERCATEVAGENKGLMSSFHVSPQVASGAEDHPALRALSVVVAAPPPALSRLPCQTVVGIVRDAASHFSCLLPR